MSRPLQQLSRHLLAALVLSAFSAAHATATDDYPPNNFDYARTTSYTYDSNGDLQTKTTEPNRAVSCSVTTLAYDAQGNIASRTVSNCPGATGRALFNSRTETADFTAQPARSIVLDPDVAGATVTMNFVPGVFPRSTRDADTTHPAVATETDPRFGVVTKATDMNGLVTTRTLDAFGRVARETYADSTQRVMFYCATPNFFGDAGSMTPNCPATPYAEYSPVFATTYTHSELRDSANNKIGGFTRTYFDTLGREVRKVSESFDGTGQAAKVAGSLVYADTAYDQRGMKVYVSAPYFVASLSSTTTGSNDIGGSLSIFDAKGRVIEVDTVDPNASASQTRYFPSRQLHVAQIYAKSLITYSGLVTQATNDHGQVRTEEHDAAGQVLRVTDALGAQVALLHDAFGNVVQTRDALQNTTNNQFDYLGARLWEQDPDKGTSQSCYDAIGQIKTSQAAVMRGSQATSVCLAAADTGLLPTTSDPHWTSYAYDQLGHLTGRLEPEMLSMWYFDRAASGALCGFGRMCESKTSLGADKLVAYDGAGHLAATRIDQGTGNPSFGWAWNYSQATGRLANVTYPTGLQVVYGYTNLGFLNALSLGTAAAVSPLPDAQGAIAKASTLPAGYLLWQATAVGALGTTEQESYASGTVVETTQVQGGTQHVLGKAVTSGGVSVANQQYVWDSVSNVKSRTDNIGDGSGQAVTENFGYDDLNRLANYSVTAPAITPGMSRSVTLQYNALGQLLYKTDQGSYVYPNSGSTVPHALQSQIGGGGTVHYWQDLDGNVTTTDGGKYTHLSYTSYDRIASADNRGYGAPTAIQYNWLYDERHARVRETRTTGGNTRTVWYVHPDNIGGLGFETEFDSTLSGQNNRHYLTAGGDIVGVLVSTAALPTLGSAPSPTMISSIDLNKVEYWHTDHLGSLIATTDHLGGVTAHYSYDPFGKRRLANGVYDAAGQLVVDWSRSLNAGTARGFTRHEELDDIGLVNMNGRVYDASAGLFVQADNHVPAESDLRAYNRYAYVLDNPLNATDPSGFDTAPTGVDPFNLLWNKLTAWATAKDASYWAGPGTMNNLSANKANSSTRSQELATSSAGQLSAQDKAEVARMREFRQFRLEALSDASFGFGLLDENMRSVYGRMSALERMDTNYIAAGHSLSGLDTQDRVAAVLMVFEVGTIAAGGRYMVVSSRRSAPWGFANADEFTQFGLNMRTGLGQASYPDAVPLLQGSAVTGRSFKTAQPFDVGRVSDFDVALADAGLLAKARRKGVDMRSGGTRTGPLSARDLRALGLRDLSNSMSEQAGRPVNFMIYDSPQTAARRAPSITLPGGN
jgi:RHS repeat-associated protein